MKKIKKLVLTMVHFVVIAAIAVPVLSALSQWLSAWIAERTNRQGKKPEA